MPSTEETRRSGIGGSLLTSNAVSRGVGRPRHRGHTPADPAGWTHEPLLLFLLLCGLVRGYTQWDDRRRLTHETPAQGHNLVRIGTG